MRIVFTCASSTLSSVVSNSFCLQTGTFTLHSCLHSYEIRLITEVKDWSGKKNMTLNFDFIIFVITIVLLDAAIIFFATRRPFSALIVFPSHLGRTCCQICSRRTDSFAKYSNSFDKERALVTHQDFGFFDHIGRLEWKQEKC